MVLLLPSREVREHMLEDMDDVHSVHSVGVVENPLYAEQEDYGDPSFAELEKKEKEVIPCVPESPPVFKYGVYS